MSVYLLIPVPCIYVCRRLNYPYIERSSDIFCDVGRQFSPFSSPLWQGLIAKRCIVVGATYDRHSDMIWVSLCDLMPSFH